MIKAARSFVWLLAVLIACAVGTVAAPARAERLDLRIDLNALLTPVLNQDRSSLRDRILGGSRQRREVEVGRFVSQGGPSFVLDQAGTRPLLRFDGSTEIWALRPSAGLRGDIYFRNDIGEVVLRATRLGGLTLYTSAAPGGLPCAVTGEAARLRLPEHDIRVLLRHFVRESVRGGQAIGTDFEITARAVDASAASTFGDAATVAVDGIVRVGQSRAGRERLAGLRSIVIAAGPGPDVRRNGETLMVTVAPRLGAAGRPSSARVARALG
ncbi:MAG TPA: DUF4908 domain-containing protein [Brevundimonas sp.]|jgi:hypothetical protein|uniref:DUF4908 domain-containing protein n=1 Tax=Brevundimonas sp. TaxID=1871086 RepID=UPI002CE95266|nr:DUF4908 domain-containing protein [Brevundimonas sp.]HRH19580.1 DUF4908 domain-containing protein [Brevundimonas sp.]